MPRFFCCPAGADGLIIEAHPDPDSALCDGPQSITMAELATIIESGRILQTALLTGAGDVAPNLSATTLTPQA